MPFSDEDIQQALITSWILEVGWYGDYITSRGSVDRTRYKGRGSHFDRCLHRAVRLLEENLTLEEQDDLIRQRRIEHRKQLDEETARVLGPSSDRKANTAALLANLKGLKL